VTLAYWEKREKAKEELARGLRLHLREQYSGLPVILLRHRASLIRADNQAWVNDLLYNLECPDFEIGWRVFFTFQDDDDGVARISDFTVVVEAI